LTEALIAKFNCLRPGSTPHRTTNQRIDQMEQLTGAWIWSNQTIAVDVRDSWLRDYHAGEIASQKSIGLPNQHISIIPTVND
jgi:hypothetical protein